MREDSRGTRNWAGDRRLVCGARASGRMGSDRTLVKKGIWGGARGQNA